MWLTSPIRPNPFLDTAILTCNGAPTILDDAILCLNFFIEMVYFAGQIRDYIGSSVIKNLISEFEEITRGYTHHLVGIVQEQMRHLRPGSSC